MSYHWNWGVFLSPVSTGEPTTYLGWLISGFWVTVTVSLASWVVALVVGPQELDAGTVGLRPLRTEDAQRQVPRQDVVSEVRRVVENTHST